MCAAEVVCFTKNRWSSFTRWRGDGDQNSPIGTSLMPRLRSASIGPAWGPPDSGMDSQAERVRFFREAGVFVFRHQVRQRPAEIIEETRGNLAAADDAAGQHGQDTV